MDALTGHGSAAGFPRCEELEGSHHKIGSECDEDDPKFGSKFAWKAEAMRSVHCRGSGKADF
ncbi:hypothetical protein GCM10010924_46170 [Rhizobium wenxiniae]|nr:hypothetical protein GCM10010924_46170 [Rhizobium wenxiniae]